MPLIHVEERALECVTCGEPLSSLGESCRCCAEAHAVLRKNLGILDAASVVVWIENVAKKAVSRHVDNFAHAAHLEE